MAKSRKRSAKAETAAEEVEDQEMRLSFEPLSDLLGKRAPRNPKKHDHDGVDASMRRFGYTIPIAIDEGTGLVVAGHGRMEVLERRRAAGGPPPKRVKVDPVTGEWLVPVLRGIRFPDPTEAEAYLVADNRHTELGGYDDGMLAEILGDHRDGAGLDGLGWTEEQATDLISAVEKATEGMDPDDDRQAPEDFKDFDADSKKTVQCPKCGFPVPCE